jgi:hypothetical protein
LVVIDRRNKPGTTVVDPLSYTQVKGLLFVKELTLKTEGSVNLADVYSLALTISYDLST